MINILIAGLIGGVIRGLVGYLKYYSSYKNTKFIPKYFFLSTGISGLVGLLATWVTKDLGLTFLGFPSLTEAIAIIIGYAGGDFIENLFKIITGKSSIYEFPFNIKK